MSNMQNKILKKVRADWAAGTIKNSQNKATSASTSRPERASEREDSNKTAFHVTHDDADALLQTNLPEMDQILMLHFPPFNDFKILFGVFCITTQEQFKLLDNPEIQTRIAETIARNRNLFPLLQNQIYKEKNENQLVFSFKKILENTARSCQEKPPYFYFDRADRALLNPPAQGTSQTKTATMKEKITKKIKTLYKPRSQKKKLKTSPAESPETSDTENISEESETNDGVVKLVSDENIYQDEKLKKTLVEKLQKHFDEFEIPGSPECELQINDKNRISGKAICPLSNCRKIYKIGGRYKENNYGKAVFMHFDSSNFLKHLDDHEKNFITKRLEQHLQSENAGENETSSEELSEHELPHKTPIGQPSGSSIPNIYGKKHQSENLYTKRIYPQINTFANPSPTAPSQKEIYSDAEHEEYDRPSDRQTIAIINYHQPNDIEMMDVLEQLPAYQEREEQGEERENESDVDRDLHNIATNIQREEDQVEGEVEDYSDTLQNLHEYTTNTGKFANMADIPNYGPHDLETESNEENEDEVNAGVKESKLYKFQKPLSSYKDVKKFVDQAGSTKGKWIDDMPNVQANVPQTPIQPRTTKRIINIIKPKQPPPPQSFNSNDAPQTRSQTKKNMKPNPGPNSSQP